MKADTMNEKTIELSDDELFAVWDEHYADVVSPDRPPIDYAFFRAIIAASRSRAASEPGEVARLAEAEHPRLHDWAMAAGLANVECEEAEIRPFLQRFATLILTTMATSPASEPDLNEILAIADEESEDSREDGNRLFTREGVAKFARRMYDRGTQSSASEAQAGWVMVPRVATTAQRLAMAKADDESGDRYRLMAAALIASAPQPASSPVAAEGQKAVKWGYAKTVGNAIAQLQTMDPALPFYAALHLQDGRCIARGVTFSRERVVNERWIDNTNKEVPYSIVVWSQPVQSLYATPTASMADAAEAVAEVVGTHNIRTLKFLPAGVHLPLGALLYASPGPRGENAGGVVEAKPFGWYGESRFENDFTTNEDTSRRWHANGYRLTPLYTHPSPAPDRGLRIAEKGDAS